LEGDILIYSLARRMNLIAELSGSVTFLVVMFPAVLHDRALEKRRKRQVSPKTWEDGLLPDGDFPAPYAQ